MKRIYISGPITGRDRNGAFEHFERAGKYLTDLGYEAVNPMKKPSEADASKPWADYMREDIALLIDCDAIYMLDGWELSRGAKLEFNIATELGMHQMFEPY